MRRGRESREGPRDRLFSQSHRIMLMRKKINGPVGARADEGVQLLGVFPSIAGKGIFSGGCCTGAGAPVPSFSGRCSHHHIRSPSPAGKV